MRKVLVIVAKSALALLSVAGVGLLVFAGWLVWHYGYAIGLPNDVRIAAVSSATERVCSVDGRRNYLPLAEIPPLLREAVIAYEEPDFYGRSFLGELKELALAGLIDRTPRRSNITTSVTHCLMRLSPECCRAIDWHVGNVVLMNRIERTLSRDAILEIFLNETYLGRSSFGVAAAAMSYFGRPLDLLSIDEIAFIAALPRAPQLLSQRKDIAVERRNFVIEQLRRSGAITEAQTISARERALEFSDEASSDQNLQKK